MTKQEEMLANPQVREVLEKAVAVLGTMPRARVMFKWTCQGCGERAVCEEENAVHVEYRHEECGHLTKAVDGNLGFLVVLGG